MRSLQNIYSPCVVSRLASRSPSSPTVPCDVTFLVIIFHPSWRAPQGPGDEGSLQRKRCLQLRDGGLGGAVQRNTLGRSSTPARYLPPGRHSWTTSRDSRGRTRRYRRDDAGLLGPCTRETPHVSGTHGRRYVRAAAVHWPWSKPCFSCPR